MAPVYNNYYWYTDKLVCQILLKWANVSLKGVRPILDEYTNHLDGLQNKQWHLRWSLYITWYMYITFTQKNKQQQQQNKTKSTKKGLLDQFSIYHISSVTGWQTQLWLTVLDRQCYNKNLSLIGRIFTIYIILSA